MDTNGKKRKPLTMMNVREAQPNRRACTQAALIIDLLNYMVTVNTEYAFVRISPIHGASMQYISTTLLPHSLHFCHHHLLAGCSGQSRPYETMQKHLYWSHITIGVYNMVVSGMSSRNIRQNNKKQKNWLLFSPESPVTFLVVDISGPLPKNED